MQFKAKKQGMISMGHSGLARKGLLDKDVPSFVRLAWKGIVDIDLLGLVLLGKIKDDISAVHVLIHISGFAFSLMSVLMLSPS